MSAEMLQAFLNIGLYFDNGTVDQQQTAQPGGTKKKPKGKLPELSCSAQEKSHCANARMCIHRDNASDFECLCRRGYAGRFCQFCQSHFNVQFIANLSALFPRSCADALSFHEDAEESNVPETGVWQLDIDGSGPLPATHVRRLSFYCRNDSNFRRNVSQMGAPLLSVTMRHLRVFRSAMLSCPQGTIRRAFSFLSHTSLYKFTNSIKFNFFKSYAGCSQPRTFGR